MTNPFGDTNPFAEENPFSESGSFVAADDDAGAIAVTEEEPKFDAAAVQWLRSRRTMVHSTEQLADFKAELAAVAANLERRKGSTVPQAVAMTLLFVLLGCIAIAVGFLVMDLGGAWISNLMEGSGE